MAGPAAAASTACMRWPRSPSGWTATATPSTDARRVLEKPGSGALARIANATVSGMPRDIAIGPRELLGRGAQKEREAKTPHHENRAQYAALFPASTGGRDARAKAERPADALQAARDLDVLHQRDVGEAADGRESVASHEDRLIAGRDAGEPRAQVHHGGDHREERMPAFDAHVE